LSTAPLDENSYEAWEKLKERANNLEKNIRDLATAYKNELANAIEDANDKL
jgi:hypothetical protein